MVINKGGSPKGDKRAELLREALYASLQPIRSHVRPSAPFLIHFWNPEPVLSKRKAQKEVSKMVHFGTSDRSQIWDLTDLGFLTINYTHRRASSRLPLCGLLSSFKGEPYRPKKLKQNSHAPDYDCGNTPVDPCYRAQQNASVSCSWIPISVLSQFQCVNDPGTHSPTHSD